MQNTWAERRLRTERRGGELLEEQIPHEGGRPKQSHGATVSNPKLDDLGINKSQSSRWQRAAAIDEAAKSLGWKSIDCHVVDIPAILLGEMDENAIGKNLDPDEYVAIGAAALKYEKGKASARMASHKGSGYEKFSDAEKGEAKAKVAKAVGRSKGMMDNNTSWRGYIPEGGEA
jgi:hypothetical protein